MERFVSKRDLLFLQGGGELGELIRTYDWSENSLGTPQTWPSSLRTALGIILHSKFPMFLFWGPHSICFYNDAYRPSLGNDGKHPYALGKPGAKVWPEIWKDINPQIQSILQGGEASWYEDQLLPIYRNGRLENAYWTYSYSPVIDETGSPAGVFVTCTETTTAVGGKKKLEESEQNLRNTILQSPVAMCILKGADNVIEIANERIIDLWGARGRNIMGQPIFAVIPELAGQGFEELLANVYTTGETYKPFGVPLTAGNNLNGLHTIYIDFLYQPYHEGDDSITGIIAVAIDATQQVVARKKLEASEARFENLIREASVGIIVLIGEEMRVSVVNSAYGRLINRTVDELLNETLFDIIPDAEATFRPLLDKVRLTGEPLFLYDTPYLVYMTGEKIEGFINVVYQPYRELDGTITGVMVLVQDVTQQVIARQKLEESDERALLYLEAGELGTIEVNLQTEAVITSKRMEEIFEIKPGEGRSVFVSKIYAEDLPKRNLAYDKALQNGMLEYEARVMQNSGSTRWIRVKGRVFFDELGKPKRLVSVVQDISKEKYFTEELQKQVSERTKELERSNDELLQFAHVASHDLKEPVRKIRTFGSRLKSDFSNMLPEKANVYLEKMESASNRIYSMIDGVLLYSSLNGAQLTKEPVDLNVVIHQIEEDLEVVVQQKEAVIYVQRLPVIDGSHMLLYQLFYNILSNSLKFTQVGIPPVIEISSQIREDISQGTNNGTYALITISDNGIGFQQAQAEKIFNTFTRLNSKDKFEGTGLGLSLCKKIVERHGGSIRAQSTENKGAIFIIHLPLKQL